MIFYKGDLEMKTKKVNSSDYEICTIKYVILKKRMQVVSHKKKYHIGVYP